MVEAVYTSHFVSFRAIHANKTDFKQLRRNLENKILMKTNDE